MSELTLLKDILLHRRLEVVFQPIARLSDCSVDAHEALIRGPEGTPLQYPDTLFAKASEYGMRVDLELAAIETILSCVGSSRLSGRFFINISGQTLASLRVSFKEGLIENWLKQYKVPPSKLVFEITEHELVTDIEALKLVVDRYRARGIGFALDDFGDGHSSLRLWAEIQPRYVKIDKFFTVDIDEVEYKRQTFKALLQLCEILGGILIAEEISRGGIVAEDRSGREAFFPLTTLSMGVVSSAARHYRNAEDVASAAALAKRQAKRMKTGLWIEADHTASTQELSA